MAKAKKTATKPAKKKASKVKPAVKAVKTPAKAKKVAKKLTKPAKNKKEPVAAKPTPAPVKKGAKVAKASKEKEIPVEVKAKPVQVVKPLAKAAPNTGKPVETLRAPQTVPKPAPPQLNIFPIPNQRPIAHKKASPAQQDERTRYSEDELKEFETLIHKKLEKARDEYRILKDTLNRTNDEGTDATSGGNTKVLEDGAETAEKENLSQLAARQQKYITNLENALVRIKNGTYGICSVTGKLIPKERLIAVPHTTQSIEAKMMQTD